LLRPARSDLHSIHWRAREKRDDLLVRLCKGQFYTPAEVSRVIAQILGIRTAKITNDTTVYDPTCGSGSLLLKIGDEAGHGHQHVKVTLYGQEKDNATAGLARMNMILHDYATAEIKQGNTISSPLYLDGDALKTFDYVVANPPFSDKRWSTGLDAEHDPWQRFQHYGIPPHKQGDYPRGIIPGRHLRRVPHASENLAAVVQRQSA
jgi:type I restriction enzyme M protein